MATEKGNGPVATGVVIEVSAPFTPIVYCETVPLALFATYTCLPEGSTATDWISSGGGLSEILEPSGRDIGGVARDAAVAAVGDESIEGVNCIDAVHGDVRHVRPRDPAASVRHRAGLAGWLSQHRDVVGGALDGLGGKREGTVRADAEPVAAVVLKHQARAGQARDRSADAVGRRAPGACGEQRTQREETNPPDGGIDGYRQMGFLGFSILTQTGRSDSLDARGNPTIP